MLTRKIAMPPAKRSKPAKAVPLRKTPQLRRASPAVIDLGALNEHVGYFVRRVQVWIFQDFIRRHSRVRPDGHTADGVTPRMV